MNEWAPSATDRIAIRIRPARRGAIITYRRDGRWAPLVSGCSSVADAAAYLRANWLDVQLESTAEGYEGTFRPFDA